MAVFIVMIHEKHNNQNDQLTSTKYYNNDIKLQITGKFYCSISFFFANCN